MAPVLVFQDDSLSQYLHILVLSNKVEEVRQKINTPSFSKTLHTRPPYITVYLTASSGK